MSNSTWSVGTRESHSYKLVISTDYLVGRNKKNYNFFPETPEWGRSSGFDFSIQVLMFSQLSRMNFGAFERDFLSGTDGSEPGPTYRERRRMMTTHEISPAEDHPNGREG